MVETVIEQPSAEEPVALPVTRQDEILPEGAHDEPAKTEEPEPEPDATATHDVKPAPPTGFRLFGLGKKKVEEKAEAAPTAVATASTYAPGSGLIEEETIDNEQLKELIEATSPSPMIVPGTAEMPSRKPAGESPAREPRAEEAG